LRLKHGATAVTLLISVRRYIATRTAAASVGFGLQPPGYIAA